MENELMLYVMGDVHGYLEVMVRHLVNAGLATTDGEWRGGVNALWFMGDFTDRGPDGVGTIEFVMRLQEDAAKKGGQVGALLGNHDVGILTAKLFPNAPTMGPGGTFYADWERNRGTVADLPRLETRHIDWLRNLPAMALVGDRLLLHADAMFYLHYGDTLEKVNSVVREKLNGSDTEEWDRLLTFADQRFAFDKRKHGAKERAHQMFAAFGGKQMIHGHTPIPKLNDLPLEEVTRAYEYCDGLAVDTDGWIYQGGAGFVYQVPQILPGKG
jgi:hypothetical protein